MVLHLSIVFENPNSRFVAFVIGRLGHASSVFASSLAASHGIRCDKDCAQQHSDKTKINVKIWKHAGAWQWRWENAKHDSLATLTAHTLCTMWQRPNGVMTLIFLNMRSH